MPRPAVREVAGQSAWILRNRNVELALTRRGGQMAPVRFRADSGHPIEPYYVSPWQGRGVKTGEPVLDPLRGDFFCMPFGANADAWRGETHRVHGETAGRAWSSAKIEDRHGVAVLSATMKTRVRPGKVTKRLSVIEGHDVVYCQHVLEGFAGSMPLGHHPTLAMPKTPGAMRVTTSAFELGMTNPSLAEPPLENEYQSLAIGEPFTDLSEVPLRFKDRPVDDLTRFPAREGYTDLLAVFKQPEPRPAWTAAVHTEGGYLWYSLKDPRVLPATVFWISNRGRQGSPWNGQNRCLGLEDVCGYFAEGLAASIKANPVSRAGFPTVVKCRADRPTIINYIQGVVPVPQAFQVVRKVRFQPGRVVFTANGDRTVTAEVQWEFLRTGELETLPEPPKPG